MLYRNNIVVSVLVTVAVALVRGNAQVLAVDKGIARVLVSGVEVGVSVKVSVAVSIPVRVLAN